MKSEWPSRNFSAMHVRLAFSSEAGRIAEILRANFPQDRLGYTIYASSGVESYIRDLIDHQDHGDSLWYVLVDEDEVRGFTEIRRGSQDLFVKHGYLDPSVRAPGVGTSLLYHGMTLARDAVQTQAGLDVFDDNTSVRRGHRALGFREVGHYRWLEIPLPEPAKTDMLWYTQGIGQADRVHQSYGFSEFTLETTRKSYRIGRIGQRLFRAMDPAVLSDPVACRALASLDPRRRLLCIGPAESFAEDVAEGSAVRARAIRMAGDLDTIVKSLAAFRAF